MYKALEQDKRACGDRGQNRVYSGRGWALTEKGHGEPSGVQRMFYSLNVEVAVRVNTHASLHWATEGECTSWLIHGTIYKTLIDRQSKAPEVFVCVYLLSFWLHWVSVAVCRLSLVVTRKGYPLIAVCRLLIAMAALIAEHWL